MGIAHSYLVAVRSANQRSFVAKCHKTKFSFSKGKAMKAATELANELKQLTGFASAQPKTVNLSDASGVEVSIDFTAIDSMSCSIEEVRLNVPALVDSNMDTVKRWAESLSERVTYLLENIGPLESDAEGRILIRSTPPNRSETTTRFYEILLQSGGSGNFSLKRYQSEVGDPSRVQVELQFTHEVLIQLVTDLIETISEA